ncbi:hypothetical protein K2173_000470 [Erythroxylum novogranatense]|uniref:Transcriptional coactivator Hfi1/Transcriptional adapter 1 n=1 Tax=Erythroxylum novogranatense TaxID=1862640 RepID=A0AAV8SXA9_9ROSI|nr:hypothetical protein K2173_000470 [Erythroxylum novogranatense]
MQPQHSSRIDLTGLKAQILKKIGVERCKKYFYSLNRFLSNKLTKSEFDKSCCRLLGRENLSLHNELIRSILKNACQAKTAPPINEARPVKSVVQTLKISPSREDGHEQCGSIVPTHNQSVPNWSNGVLPMSPRKARTVTRERKIRDRPSPLGPNGKIECVPHQSIGAEDAGNKVILENVEMPPCDYQRPFRQLHTVAEQPRNERDGQFHKGTGNLRTHSKDQPTFVEDKEEVEQDNQLNFCRSSLLAPLGIPFCSASVGGARKAMPMTYNGGFVRFYDSGFLSGTEMLRKRMEQIASAQGLGGVSVECANMLNNMLDAYLKRLIRSCVELVGARTSHDRRKLPAPKHLPQGKTINGMWPNNHVHAQGSGRSAEVTQEQRPHCPISLVDFKVAMELNPQQLGEDWPLLLEKISMHLFED